MKAVSIEWEGSHISLNQWYSSKHWSFRNRQKKEWGKVFLELCGDQIGVKFDRYEIYLYFNSRLDPSNTITMIKLFEDFMKERGMIIDDNKKHCKGIHLIPDESMNKMHYRIMVNEVD